MATIAPKKIVCILFASIFWSRCASVAKTPPDKLFYDEIVAACLKKDVVIAPAYGFLPLNHQEIVDQTLNAQCVRGNVFIEDQTEGLYLPNLEYIDGDLVMAADVLKTISLPHLQGITGSLIIMQAKLQGKPKLETASFPRLSSLLGALVVKKTLLKTLDFPALKQVHQIILDDNTALKSLSMPELATVNGGIWIGHHSKLVTIGAPQLEQIGQFLVAIDNAELPNCEADSLAKKANLLAMDPLMLSPGEQKQTTSFHLPLDTSKLKGFLLDKNNKQKKCIPRAKPWWKWW